MGGTGVSAELDPGTSALASRARASVGVLTAAGTAAMATGALVIWLAVALQIRGPAWLPWLLLALSPAAAGGVCLARRRHWRDAFAPGAVLGSCVAAIGVCVPVGSLQRGTVVTVIALLAVVGGGGAVAAAIALRALQPRVWQPRVRQPRVLAGGGRLRLWWAAALLVTAASIPSPAYFPPGPIGTVFTGDSAGQDIAVVLGLLLVALPLVVAGLVPARTSVAIAAGWLPVIVAQLIAGPIIQTAPASLDAWYYLSWLPWLAVVLLAIAAARTSRPGTAALFEAHAVGAGEPAQQWERGEDHQQ
jgi:hypothetical protein